MWGDSINTMEAVQYCGGIAAVHVGIASVLWRDSVSTVEAIQYCGLWDCGGTTAVLQGDSISTCGG